MPQRRPPTIIETARLRLRPPEPGDARAIFERWAQDAEVTRYLVWRPHRHVGETEEHIARCVQGWESGRSFTWLILNRETDELLGSIAARDGEHGVNLGYLLARSAWGHGYMVEALEPVVSWALAQPEIYRVWATCDVDNRASARVLEKAGFEYEGTLRRWDEHPNIGTGRRDALCFSRTR